MAGSTDTQGIPLIYCFADNYIKSLVCGPDRISCLTSGVSGENLTVQEKTSEGGEAMLRRIRQHWKNYIGTSRMALIGCIILGIWIVLAVAVPLLGPWSFSEQNAAIRNQTSSLMHWFGTDRFGRDLFARVWYGAGISLAVGIISTVINGIIGVFYGAVSGYAGKYTDMALMRIADIISAIPSMLYVILITLVMGAGVGSMILGLCVAGWISMARIVRGEIIKLKETEYAYAARMEGIKPLRILLRHLLPNTAGTIVVNMIFLVPQAIFTEAFLSFLGVGIAAPAASLGTIIQEARSQMMLYPYQMIYPLLVLCIMLLALNMVGNAVEQRLGIHSGKGTGDK